MACRLHDEDSRAPTPPYIKALADQGWDTFRLNRLREAESLSGTAARLAKAARDLRAQGYTGIGLAGQSFGAFAALAAVAEDGRRRRRDRHGPGRLWQLFRILRRHGGPMRPNFTACFARSAKPRSCWSISMATPYDPGGRADASRTILAGRQARDLIIDQPADLIGHSAAASGLFARRFAACIGRFIAGFISTDADESACETSWGRRSQP